MNLSTLSKRNRVAVRVISWCIAHLPDRELSQAITESLNFGTAYRRAVEVWNILREEQERQMRPNA